MNVRVVYCNHQSTGLNVREKLAFPNEAQLTRAYGELRVRFPRSEHVVVSTCNRIEIYTAQEDGTDAPELRDVAQFFSEFHDVPVNEFFDGLLEQSGPDAVRHLFEVASSLDSMVLGESQIVNQVKTAYEAATRCQANGPLTNALFQRALSVSSRVRTQTRLSEGRVSIASVAVGDFAKNLFARFDDKTVLVIGAGEMAEETLRYLKDEGVGRILICNRSEQRGQALAHDFAGEYRPWDELDNSMAEADVIVSATGADRPVVDRERFRRIRAVTGTKPVFILDLGAPRDFQPEIRELDDSVFLYCIDELNAVCQANHRARAKERDKAQKIIAEETGRFMQDIYHRATGPIVRQLRATWHEVSRQELEQLFQKLPNLSDPDRQAVARSVERIVNKLLHPPLEALRAEAQSGTPHGLMQALLRLFGLGE